MGPVLTKSQLTSWRSTAVLGNRLAPTQNMAKNHGTNKDRSFAARKKHRVNQLNKQIKRKSFHEFKKAISDFWQGTMGNRISV